MFSSIRTLYTVSSFIPCIITRLEMLTYIIYPHFGSLSLRSNLCPGTHGSDVLTKLHAMTQLWLSGSATHVMHLESAPTLIQRCWGLSNISGMCFAA